MTVRTTLIAAAAALLLTAHPAMAQAPEGGTGENVEFIANNPLWEGEAQRNEIELAGDYAFVSGDPGLAIVDITNPLKPTVVGRWECEAGWGDVDLTADGKIAVLTDAHDGECLDGDTAVALVDVSDVRNPQLLSSIPLSEEQEYVHTATVDGNHLYLNIQEALFYPQASRVTPVYDISNPREPRKIINIEFPSGEEGVNHDSYVDHRPDGKVLMYGASAHATDIFDVTNIMEPVRLQRFYTADMTISHQAEPNFDRSVLIVEDESAVDAGLAGAPGAVCGKTPGPEPLSFDVGSTMFFEMAPDGTVADPTGSSPLGAYNRSFAPHSATCTAHVFWQAPDENRLTQAWYSQGALIIDFADPTAPKEIGSFVAEGDTMYWSAKAHRGYIFATDMVRGLDVLKYTGEGGARWPATSGYADVQRARRMGLTWTPPQSGQTPLPNVTVPQRTLGRFAFTRKVKRVPGRKGKRRTLKLAFRDAKGKRVGTFKVRKRAGRKARIKVTGIAEVGTYRWTLKAGRRTLARGRTTAKSKPNLTLAPNRRLTASVK